MRKFLAGFLLTLRWLLVLLLPPLGLFVGLLLTPPPSPAWQRTLENDDQCAGMVAVPDGVVLALYRPADSGQPTHYILGLDATTGQVRFTTPLPVHPMMKVKVIPDTTKVLYFNRLDSSSPLILYDWLDQEELFRGIVREEYLEIRSVHYRNKILLADLGGLRQGIIAFWHTSQPPLTQPRLLFLPDSFSYDLQFSSTGIWVSSYSGSPANAGLLSLHQIKIIDVQTVTVIQTLPAEISKIYWLPDQDAFLAVRADPVNRNQNMQRYAWDGQHFAPTGELIPLMTGTQMQQGCSSWMSRVVSQQEDPARKKMAPLFSFAGELGDHMLQRLWPDGCLIQQHRRTDGRLVDQLPLHDKEFKTLAFHTRVYLDLQGRGLALHHKNQLDFWLYHPPSRWYLRLSFSLGIFLAILVAWLNLKKRSFAITQATSFHATSTARS